jgi:F-type H+-transporting ATPase subunit a
MFKNLIIIINSPLEQFEVSNLISVIAPIFGYINISLSNLGLYSILILFIILSLHIISNNENKILPSK